MEKVIQESIEKSYTPKLNDDQKSSEKDIELQIKTIRFEDKDICISVKEYQFTPNQDVKIEYEEDILCFTVNQLHSTPGVICEHKIFLPLGSYKMSVIGHSEVAKTFFPWARNCETKVRITETTHISQSDVPTTILLTINVPMVIEIGVLSHKTQIGDKCWLKSISISKTKKHHYVSPFGRFISLSSNDFKPHGHTKLEKLNEGLQVTSQPIKTPGAYAIIDVTGGEILSLSISVSITFPNVAFVYIADLDSRTELTRRTTSVFRSSENTNDEYSTLQTFVKIPSDTKKIRIGLLFSSTVTKQKKRLIIREFEIVPYVSLMDICEELYVLSLKGEEDKFEHCLWQAEKQGIRLTKWEAVNGNDSIHKKDWQNYLSLPYTDEEKRLNRKAINYPGAWGYMLSMKEVFRDAIKKGHNAITVFDNDFIISKGFDHGFSRLIHSIKKGDWDIIYLGASQWCWDDVKSQKKPYYFPDSKTNGTFAVIYHRAVFQRLIERIEAMLSPFDSGPLRDIVLSTSFGRSYVAYPNLIIANVEKSGIRESRNQNEYARRFRWNLDDYPAWFTRWSRYPILLKDRFVQGEYTDSLRPRKHFITGVTTFNRIEYLKNFIKTWYETIDFNADQTLLIADDGSNDGTSEWIENEVFLPGVKLKLIHNNGSGIARQSNSLLNIISEMHPKPSLGFLCNDDIYFTKEGWQTTYYDAILDSGYDHLVYFNATWKKPSLAKEIVKSKLRANCNSREAMGCFYTVTPRLINEIGFFDEQKFPVRGHSHIDFTMRACRIGANESDNLFDYSKSNDYINMFQKEGYVGTHRILTYQEHVWTKSEDYLQIREKLLQDEKRIFVNRPW